MTDKIEKDSFMYFFIASKIDGEWVKEEICSEVHHEPLEAKIKPKQKEIVSWNDFNSWNNSIEKKRKRKCFNPKCQRQLGFFEFELSTPLEMNKEQKIKISGPAWRLSIWMILRKMLTMS